VHTGSRKVDALSGIGVVHSVFFSNKFRGEFFWRKLLQPAFDALLAVKVRPEGATMCAYRQWSERTFEE
jgi:hypothetical protein